jgi:hypothetical protein
MRTGRVGMGSVLAMLVLAVAGRSAADSSISVHAVEASVRCSTSDLAVWLDS